MRSLSRRLQRLESISIGREDWRFADRGRFISRAVLEHLSTDQLRCLIEVHKAVQQGRELTSQELAAVNTLNTATEEECRKAGASIAEFNRYHRSAGGRGRPS